MFNTDYNNFALIYLSARRQQRCTFQLFDTPMGHRGLARDVGRICCSIGLYVPQASQILSSVKEKKERKREKRGKEPVGVGGEV